MRNETGPGNFARPRLYTSPSGQVYSLYKNMLEQPHLLIAGKTGSGKSVLVNALIYTALFRHPGDAAGAVEFILIDPKRVELSAYKNLPHTWRYASEPRDRLFALADALKLCDDRYKRMSAAGVKKYGGGDVWIVIDEFADLMTTQKKAVLPLIQRIAQIGRAARVRLLLATQTPIAKILPTEVKCNFDSRVALRTRSAQDSRNITGFAGCEKLPGYGYGYYMTPEGEAVTPLPMIPEDELARMVEFWTAQTE